MFNLAAYVLQHAQSRADHSALIALDGEVLTYAVLDARVRGMATGLLQQGLNPGDRILMRLGNTPTFPMTYLAAITAGLIPVPTSPTLTTPEITAIAHDIAPALVVYAEGTSMPDGDWPHLNEAALTRMWDLPPAAFALGDPHRPAYIVYTSGTSGHPRAVVHAHRAILARKTMWTGWYDLQADDRLLHAGAFNWTYTLGTGLMDPWSVGATALIPADGTAPTDLPSLMAAHDVTIFAAAPGVYRRLLRTDFPDLPKLRHGLSAGEKLPATTRKHWESVTSTTIHEAYGMSECSTFISGAPARPAPPDTLGYPQPDRQIALIADGKLADHGTIAVHRDDPGLMLGYLDQPAETAAKYDGDWFLTGDIGARDASGAITYLGRTDDMMNAGGTRVSPIEVEEAMTLHPRISECAAAEVRLRTDLSLIAAFYTGTDVIDENELAAHASARLAPYKVPRLFVRVDALPRGTNNKLLRAKLRHDWEAAHGQA